MISEFRSSRQVEFQKIPIQKNINQPKKISKSKVPEITGKEFFPNRNVIIWCLLINEMKSEISGCY